MERVSGSSLPGPRISISGSTRGDRAAISGPRNALTVKPTRTLTGVRLFVVGVDLLSDVEAGNCVLG